MLFTIFFFFKQKTAYEMRISDWSSDVCSSDLWVTGSDGGRWPRALWRPEVTEIVGVGQARDIEFIAAPGDWALHCHMSHHTMNAMGHGIASPIGVDTRQVADEKIGRAHV